MSPQSKKPLYPPVNSEGRLIVNDESGYPNYQANYKDASAPVMAYPANNNSNNQPSDDVALVDLETAQDFSLLRELKALRDNPRRLRFIQQQIPGFRLGNVADADNDDGNTNRGLLRRSF